LFKPASVETRQLCGNTTKAMPLPGTVVMDTHTELHDQATREILSSRKQERVAIELAKVFERAI